MQGCTRQLERKKAGAMHRRCGQVVDIVPQIFIGDTRIAGWRKMEPMIATGAIDSLIGKSYGA
jgi:hypothetical protein